MAAYPTLPTDTQGPDLHLYIVQSGSELHGVLEYNACLFRPETIKRLAGHLVCLAEGAIANLNRPIASLPLLTSTEDQQLEDWGSPYFELPQQPIFTAIEAHAAARPAAIALNFKDQYLSYGELNQRANQLAHYLIQRGVGPGVRVASCLDPCLDVLVAVLAIFKAGGTYVPLDPSHPQERLTAILEDTLPPLLLTQAHLVSVVPAIAPQTFCLDQDWTQVRSQPTHNPNLPLDLDQIAYIIYTSGTTGKPKGVMASHRNLLNYIWVAQEKYGFNANDVMPAMARFTFSITMFELFSPLVAGGRLIILERDHVLDFKRLVQTLQEITVIHISPSLMRKLLAYIQEQGIDLQTLQGLRHISSGGDMVPADLLDQLRTLFPQAELYVIYGCSEISCMGCTYPVPTELPITETRVGKPFSNVSVQLYDPQQNRVPIGVIGEIYFGGAGITQGYLNRDHLTQEKFVTIDGQRFYRTGDLGRFDTHGNLEILGRSDFQIKLRGIRMEPGDIEAALRQAPGVRDAVVAACEVGNREKSLVAYLVPQPQQTLNVVEIRRFLQTKLPDYMVPTAFMALDALPVNINQKVDRKALPLPTPQDLLGTQSYVAPRNEVEQKLASIWESALGTSPISVQDNFFDVGGDSLQSIAVMIQIEQTFGKTLPLSTLLTEPTIEQMAAVLTQSKPSDLHKSVVLLKPGGSKPPIFFVHDGEGETLLYRNLALSLHPDHPVYGLQPYSRDGFPILHTRLDEMATYYMEQICLVQPEGPYFLGGLCIGGFLAFEIARKLRQRGQAVEMIALIDTADVKAELRSNLYSTERRNRLSQALGESQQRPVHQRVWSMARTISAKAFNLVRYEVSSRLTVIQCKLRMRLLRYYLDRGWGLPAFLEGIPVRVALKFAEKEYVPAAPYQGEVLLFLATEKSPVFDGTEIDDTPYAHLYADPLLGWEVRVTDGVCLHKVPGGHSSMLQEPNVRVLAKTMQAYIDARMA
ncbi:amino acid adenylation domain-containing protein [Nodosilinea sp. E11]|uniref:non-ribosomal peptide synthetase n=1 Tax=Nodosilinea sp. E11 TaxID=3037479 RepID=UPI002934838A|nr:amino acid adenylation domain-containing protein [Nodosilinea sp. E11]WOD39790.1 amino acid adenylation domain-containing protein [Nodosilinea sp. E11]